MTPELTKVCEDTAEKLAMRYYIDTAKMHGVEYAKGRSGYKIMYSDFKECFQSASEYHEKKVQGLIEALTKSTDRYESKNLTYGWEDLEYRAHKKALKAFEGSEHE